MAAGQFDILADQGANYVLYFTYEENDNSVIDLTNYNGRMQVRRSAFSTDILLSCAGNTASGGVTGGGVTGSFTGTGGVAGSGTMLLNASAAGLTGATGATGGVFVSLDSTSMSNIPHGRHVYDIELIAGDTVSRVVQGRFEVRAEVTR
tara:strand:+ start:182 stop:628 length:447 start_codon:yes stop_codon:yes gene_type:complete